MAPKFPQNPSRSYWGNAPISALLQQGRGDRGLPAAPRPKSKRRRAGSAVPGGSCRSRPAAVDAAGWVPARQDAPRADCSAPLAAPLSKTTDIFRAMALAVGGVMSTYVEQGRNLLPQQICLGMARVRRRLRRQPRHSPGSTNPALPCSRDGKRRRGKELGEHLPFPILLSLPFTWEQKELRNIAGIAAPQPAGGWGQGVRECPSRRCRGLECAWHAFWQYKPFALLSVATTSANAPSPRSSGCQPGDLSPVVVAAAIRKTNLLPRNPALMRSWEFNNNPMEQHGSGERSGSTACPRSVSRSELLPCQKPVGPGVRTVCPEHTDVPSVSLGWDGVCPQATAGWGVRDAHRGGQPGIVQGGWEDISRAGGKPPRRVCTASGCTYN